MKTGLLWVDDDKKRTLAEKVECAAAFYRQAERYHGEPDACHVNPAMLNGERAVNGVVLVESVRVRPMCFWIGVSDETAGFDD